MSECRARPIGPILTRGGITAAPENEPVKTPIAFPILLVAAALCLGGCEDKINDTSFAQIQPGMALHEVEQLLGGKGEMEKAEGVSIGASGLASSSGAGQAVYVWKKNGKLISVTVEKGKVVSMGRSGF